MRYPQKFFQIPALIYNDFYLQLNYFQFQLFPRKCVKFRLLSLRIDTGQELIYN